MIASADPCLPCAHTPTLYPCPLHRCEWRKAGHYHSRIEAWQERGKVAGSKAIESRRKPRNVSRTPRRKSEVNSIQSKVECWERVRGKHPILSKSVKFLLFIHSYTYEFYEKIGASRNNCVAWKVKVFMVTYTCHASILEAEAGRYEILEYINKRVCLKVGKESVLGSQCLHFALRGRSLSITTGKIRKLIKLVAIFQELPNQARTLEVWILVIHRPLLKCAFMQHCRRHVTMTTGASEQVRVTRNCAFSLQCICAWWRVCMSLGVCSPQHTRGGQSTARGVSSLLSSCRVGNSNSDCQSWWKEPWATEPRHRPLLVYFVYVCACVRVCECKGRCPWICRLHVEATSFLLNHFPNLDLGRSFSLNWELTDSAMLIGQQVQGILLPLMASAMGLQVSP